MQKESEQARVGITKKLDSIDDSFEKMSDTMTAFILKVETQFITKSSAEKRFAGKLSEKVVYGMVGTILTFVLYTVLK